MPNAWMIRSGRGAEFLHEFLSKNIAAIGWHDLESIATDDVASLKARLAECYPHYRKGQIAVTAGMLRRFRDEIAVGDRVVTYDPERRIYHLGTVTSDYRYDPEALPNLPQVRSVTWEQETARDDLKQSTRNKLGAISTLFSIDTEACADLENPKQQPEPAASSTTVTSDDESVEDDIIEDVGARALELIKDTVRSLDDRQMEDLLAGILRAMGYKSKVSPVGPDRGVDVTASPDGLGLEQPRIKAEVKHRPTTQMGAQDVRNFIATLRPGDSGLYLSTGGFSENHAMRPSGPTFRFGCLSSMTLSN
ncbi:MAG: restriction endonuclease [Planctomycetota bacterium]|jgi:restriction system protein|nr:restriction endonuclease [Planctomycetota bacterium]